MVYNLIFLTFLMAQPSQSYLDVDLNENGRIDADEYKLVTDLFLADGYRFDENGNPVPQQVSKEIKEETVNLPGDIPLDLLRIPAGSFLMGEWSLDGYNNRVDFEPVKVVISQDFYIGQFEVTQEQFQALMDYNPSLTEGSQYPVESISWLDGQAFIDRLNGVIEGGGFRYPTNAEWEYACRAGTTTTYYWGDDPSLVEDHEWVDINSQYNTLPVGLLEPNPWGLYDIQGNVCEFVMDGVAFVHASLHNVSMLSGTLLIDPIGELSHESGYIRGGSIHAPSEYYRSFFDSGFISPSIFAFGKSFIGFRIARDVVTTPPIGINQWMVF